MYSVMHAMLYVCRCDGRLQNLVLQCQKNPKKFLTHSVTR